MPIYPFVRSTSALFTFFVRIAGFSWARFPIFVLSTISYSLLVQGHWNLCSINLFWYRKIHRPKCVLHYIKKLEQSVWNSKFPEKMSTVSTTDSVHLVVDSMLIFSGNFEFSTEMYYCQFAQVANQFFSLYNIWPWPWP